MTAPTNNRLRGRGFSKKDYAVTEEEARKKWCPFAKSRSVEWWSDASTKNVATFQINDLTTTTCVGPLCMAWQVTYHNRNHRLGTHVPNGGYCGLAGAPR